MDMTQQFGSSDVSSASSANKKPWEHPWTVDEMKKAAEHWSLASDVGMLLHLQEFSQKLLKQTHEIQDQVDSLNHDTKLTNIRLHNVFNDFVMLANTQFMENRVYDEEVVVQEQTNGNKKSEEKEKTQQEKEMELIPKIKQAISFGLNVFDTAYEKLDMNIANSESEDEDNSTARTNIILEPKDPYLLRPLPYLIGSQQFFQSDNLGLSSLLVDESVDQDSDHISDDETLSPKEVKPPVKSETRAVSSSSESDEDLFSESKPKTDAKTMKDDDSKDEDSDTELPFEDNVAKTAKNPLSDLQSELARKLGAPGGASTGVSQGQHGDTGRDEAPAAKPRTSKIVQPPPPLGGADIFGAAAEDPDDDIFSRPSRPFSSRPTLFDDEDDDSGGLFIPKKNSQQNSQPKQDQQQLPPAKNSDFARSIDSDGRMTSTPQSTGQETSQNKKEGKSLFDQEEEDEEEDLFASKPVAAARQTKETKKFGASLFADEDEENDDSDIFGSKPDPQTQTLDKSSEVSTKPKIPAGAVSIFGGGENLFKAAVLKTKKDENADDKSLSKPSLVKASKTAGSTDAIKSTPGSSSPSTVSTSSLFAEDPELFSAPSKSKPSADLGKEPSSQTKAKSSLGLFAADDEEDDLFATMSKPFASSSTKTLAKEPEPAKKAPKLLFGDEDDDDDEGDLFSFSRSPSKDDKKNLKLIDEAVSKKSKPEITPTETKDPSKEPTKETTKPKTTKVSLFSSSDDEDDNFFSGTSKKSPAKLPTPEKSSGSAGVSKPAPTGRTLFDDDDFLFGKSDNNGPSVDLFKSPAMKKVEVDNSVKKTSGISLPPDVSPSATATSAAIPVQLPVASKPKDSGTKLFGSFDDDEEDDLFATLNKKPSIESKATSKPPEVLPAQKPAAPDKVDAKPKDIFEDIFNSKTTTSKDLLSEAPSAQNTKSISFNDPLGSAGNLIEPRSKAAESIIPSNDPLAANKVSDNQDLDAKGASLAKEKLSAPSSPTLPKPLPKTSAKTNRISQLQASMNIDPTAHLPQKHTKKEENTDSAVNFDLPPPAATLHSLAKDRAKIPIKRRPPTRKHVEPQDDQDDGFHEQKTASDINTDRPVPHLFKKDFNLESQGSPETLSRGDEPHGSDQKQNEVPSTNSANSLIETKQDQASSNPVETKPNIDIKEQKSKITSKPIPSKFLASDDDDNDGDIFGSIGKTQSTISENKSVESSGVKVTRGVLDRDDDLFGENDFLTSSKNSLLNKNTEVQKRNLASGQSATGSSLVEPKKVDDDDDDLFGGSVLATNSKSSKALPEKSKEVAHKRDEIAPKKTEPVLSSDEDIFSGPKKISAPSKAANKPAAVVTKQVEDDDDDIFASSSVAPKASSRPSKVKPKIHDQFGDDDDDIFANIPPASAKTKTVQKKELISDEDDLFGSSSRTIRPAYKKPTTKDEDLFRDDTDIFADIPSLKPREAKSASKKIQPTTTAAVFVDDSDDIFAEASAATKPKQIATEIQKPTVQPTDDFDDIFEDPLNVLRK